MVTGARATGGANTSVNSATTNSLNKTATGALGVPGANGASATGAAGANTTVNSGTTNSLNNTATGALGTNGSPTGNGLGSTGSITGQNGVTAGGSSTPAGTTAQSGRIGGAPSGAVANPNLPANNTNLAGSSTASGTASATPSFLGSVQSKSTPARGLNGSAMSRLDSNERRITGELNRASASSTGNANSANQASLNGAGNTVTQ
jgi:hypothetical protein